MSLDILRESQKFIDTVSLDWVLLDMAEKNKVEGRVLEDSGESCQTVVLKVFCDEYHTLKAGFILELRLAMCSFHKKWRTHIE